MVIRLVAIVVLLSGAFTRAAQAQTIPPPLDDAQQTALKAIQAEAEQRAAPVALQLASVVRKIYQNNLSDMPEAGLRATLDAQMKELVWQLLEMKGGAMWAAFRVLTPPQKDIVRAQVLQRPTSGDLPDLMDVITHTFAVDKK